MNQVGSISTYVNHQDQDSFSTGNKHILNKCSWILDSGITNHVCFNIFVFTYQSYYHKVT